MNTHMKLLLSGAAVSCLMLPAPVLAQSASGVNDYEEITVTGRKREETLVEVPVSISVLNDALIEDTGILTQEDLFTLVPGIQYDEPLDRNSASPSIRGVQSNEVATNRAKATQFIDGMPVLGSQGNIQFGAVQQVEVYRGPQSAAFGRSTFAGAINYVTKDPGDEFEADGTFQFDDFGTRRIGAAVSGPITDTLGFRLDYQWEDSDSIDDYTTNEGLDLGARSSDGASAKLVWEPNDALTAELAYHYVKSEDRARASYQLSPEQTAQCWDGTQLNSMGVGYYAYGQPNCDWSQGVPVTSQINLRPALEQYIASSAMDGDINDYITDFEAVNGAGSITREQIIDDLLFIADAESIEKSSEGAYDERTRISLQVDYAFDNGSLMQFSAFTGEEEYIRLTDGGGDTRPIQIATPILNPGAMETATNFYSITGGATGTVGTFMADPTEIEELYAEVRYVSPGEDRLRYVVGASYYDYSFLTEIYFGGYEAIFGSLDADRYNALLGEDSDVAGQVFAEDAENFGIYGNVSYDFTENLTATFEGRFQSDTVGGQDAAGNGDELTTETFLPRLSVNYNLDSGTSFYAQYARGANPAGINVGFYEPSNEAQLNCYAFTTDATTGVSTVTLDAEGNPVFIDGATRNDDGSISITPGSDANLQNGINGEDTCGQNHVDFTAETFQTYEEETIDSYEIGAKGRLFDGALEFATAAFYLDWKNQARSANLSWRDLTAMGMTDFSGNRTFINEGDIISVGLEVEGTWRLTDEFSVRGSASIIESEYDTFCDVAFIAGTGFATDELGAYLLENQSLPTDADNTTGYTCTDVSGNTVENHSSLTGSLSPSYRTDLSNGLTFDARADIRYEGAQYIDTVNAWETNPVTTVNVSTGLSGDRWGLTLYVNNLFDENQPLRYGNGDLYEVYDGGAAIDLVGQSVYSVTPRTPRSIGLRGSVNY